MSEKIMMDVLQAVALFFLNPVFLVTLLIAVAIGYFRVKRERRSFRVRLLPGWTELKRLVPDSIGYALLLSLLICGAGLTVDPGWLVLFSAAMLIAILTFYFKWASPVYFAAAATVGLVLLQRFAGDFTVRGWSPSTVDWSSGMLVTIPVLAGLLLIVEGFLISRHTARYASPYLKETDRGLHAAVFKAKRIWLLPVLFLVPGDMISAYLPYWPQFTLGERAFSFIPVPIVIGFSQVARSLFPETLFPKMGQAVSWTGVAVVLVGLSAIWMPILGWTALVIGVICRLFLSILVSIRERKGRYAAAPRSAGVVIAGVLPDSPGEKMGLAPGECIRAVNGVPVSNEKELYDAIQINAAHCRLQVIDRDGEVRLMQQVLYRYDHHRLGVLVVR
ncbi:PDZ domain-containing protein [Sporosarcina sp. 179-K 3D1 HS]|uniref:PDZ domain-containing protein n=1 Tax=Sporosarcina sp. 179-K 3D1 HS TaxID=3232169 RepID=UPI00399FC0E8